MAGIGIRDVVKRYGDTKVIHGVSIDVADGEFIVIVGPSGCGKSTLLRMVAGLEEITGGEVAIDGRVVNRLEPKDRNIAMVFQNYALYPHMSVYDNMAYGLKIAGLSKDAIRERVDKAARMLQLEPYLDRKPRQLSGGQRQRVAMGRCIVREPAAFLFDEPLSNLDAKLRVQMRLEIKQLQRSLGTTALYVTHDQVEAMTLADRLVVMNGGVAEQIDTPMNVYLHPATTFVAGFIGSPAMNFMPGRLGGDGRAITLDTGAPLRALPEPIVGHGGEKPVTIGVRPEHLALVGQPEAELTLRARVVETLGADTLVHGVLLDKDAAIVPVAGEGGEVLAARLPGNVTVREGDTLPLRVAEGALHVFDRETGRRLADV
ncbi:sn-glycerol-3-phosphate import ATP-binding protein UgpC [Salinarimonas ramus]|uniref:Sn-glycerol-3-phosphate import ATP-binding protein UgpC n=1 Tax=Salinarimonas ramus TaxID=690164 RepID=A0A917Q633_9HYPH|nr:sn-glycerol-3-phosphate import ATP-binding protein UgpC [Salinarimonas ramus]GGK28660.1 sn-glycerol-3-phosphate import ATP-binding protein UgpC [Salinarimonas ramus]